MPRQSIELAADRPYPVRILQVPVERGQLLEPGEPLCILQWADDEVQRIVLDAQVVVDTLGVRAGETYHASATLALVRPAEDTVASVGKPAAQPSGRAPKPPRSWGVFLGLLAVAAVTGFFLAGSVYRLPLHPGVGVAILVACALGMGLLARSGRKGAGLACVATFGVAAVAAGMLGGRTDRHVDWLRDLPDAILGAAEPDFAGRPRLTLIELPPIPEGVPPGSPTELMLDEYAWALSVCLNLDASCIDDGTPEECATRVNALQAAWPSLIPSEALEARMQIATTPERSEFAVGEDETCETYLLRSGPLHEAALELLNDELGFLDELAEELGKRDWPGSLEQFLNAAAPALGNCSGLGEALGHASLFGWSESTSEDFSAAFPNSLFEDAFLDSSDDAALNPELIVDQDRTRRLIADCEALRKTPLRVLSD